FSWSSFTFLKQAPKSEAVVMIVTVAVILYTSNLAIGVVIGVILSTFIFVANISRLHIEIIDGIYKVKGPLFFASTSMFIKKLEIASESKVIIDFEDSQIWDESAVGAMLKVKDKLKKNGQSVHFTGLNTSSQHLYNKVTYRGGSSMRIAVAIDGSDYAFRAAEHAVTLAKHFPTSEIIIIFVKDYSKAKDEYLTAQSVESMDLKREQKIQPII